MPGATPTKLHAPPVWGEGADPPVTRDLEGGIPSKREGEGPVPLLPPSPSPRPGMSPARPPSRSRGRLTGTRAGLPDFEQEQNDG